MRGWVGPSAGFDLLGKRESPWSARSRTPDRPAPWQLAALNEQIQLSWPSVPCARLSRPLFHLQARAPRGQAGAAFNATTVVRLTRRAPCGPHVQPLSFHCTITVVCLMQSLFQFTVP